MKILLVIDTLSSGGAQRLFINIVNGLAALHEVTVFLYNDNSDFYRSDLLETIPVIRAERSLEKGFSWDVLRQIARHMRQNRVTVSFLPTANIYCAMGRVLAPRARHISCEMSVTNENESRWRRTMTNLANLMATHVVCNSHTQTAYVAAQPFMKRKASTIWNGCRDMPFTPRAAVDPRAHSMIVVGRIAYPKNGVRLVQALQIFYEKHGFIPRVSWAGRDDVDTPRSMAMKRQMVELLDAHPAVKAQFHFLGEVSDVGALYAQSDTLISPSIYEGLPVVICEAMLSGCAVIASRVSDNSAILGQQEERGFLCDPLSPADIAAAIERRLAMTPEAHAQMVARARAFAAEKFSIEQMVTQYRRIIETDVWSHDKEICTHDKTGRTTLTP